jgi:integrase
MTWCFTAPDGQPLNPDTISQWFERVVRRSSLPRIRLHDLRHTHATHLLAAGVNVKIVSERLGHASTSFTLDTYGHVMPGQQATAAAVAALVD